MQKSNKKMSKRGLLIILTVTVFLGIMVTRQFYLSERINKQITPQSSEELAFEVSELFKSNEKLSTEVDRLNTELEKLNKTFIDSKEVNEALDEKTKNYEIVLGLVDVKGEGVKIEFDNKISFTQIIDLLNAIKNIGADAMAINNQRVTVNTAIENGVFSPPLSVEVIGDKHLLYSSLTRSGGIIDQIGYGSVEKYDEIFIDKITNE